MKFVGVGKGHKVFLVVGKRDVRELGDYDWGANPPTEGMRNLARRMLIEVLGGDTVQATKYYMRFMYRVLSPMKPDDDWKMDGGQVDKIVEALKTDERDVAMIRQMVGREGPRIASAGPQFPGASGFGGNDSAPDRRRK